MVTRRDLVTGGALGAVSGSMFASSAEAAQSDGQVASAIRGLSSSLEGIRSNLDTGFESNRVGFGHIPQIRNQFTTFLRTHFKFPDYMEIGISVFYDLYDWHIKQNLPIEIARATENRIAIRFMFTMMILRPEQDLTYLGVPFDRA